MAILADRFAVRSGFASVRSLRCEIAGAVRLVWDGGLAGEGC